jgi:hypothetical protein
MGRGNCAQLEQSIQKRIAVYRTKKYRQNRRRRHTRQRWRAQTKLWERLPRTPAPATPYALAQGVRSHSDGRAWWWLADAHASRSPIVWYNGNVIDSGVDVREAAVGVRPLLKLNLENIHLTAGSGTKEDPFR